MTCTKGNYTNKMNLDFIKNKMRIDFSKNTKMLFYIKGLWILFAPKFIYNRDFLKTISSLSKNDLEYIKKRVDYYNKFTGNFEFLDDRKTILEFIKQEEKKTYFFDLLQYLKYFNYKNKISYVFGDVIEVPKIPSIVKSRPIDGDNKNSIVMKLNKVRHFIFVDDEIQFENKINQAVWRGKCYKSHRTNFVKRFYDSPLCNIGQVNTKGDLSIPWQKEKLSLKEQMKYKFLIAIEGNDVASNLKWAMSSNSLVMMAKPKYETWFMEGTLIENFHYVLLRDDYSDLEEKIKYYIVHADEAKIIIRNANSFVEQFKNRTHEDVISYLVLDKYFKYTLPANKNGKHKIND